MLKNFVKVVQDARERNKTIILPDENVIPSNIGVDIRKVEHLDLQKPNSTIKYNRVCAKVTPLSLCSGKYKFTYVAPHKTSDKGAYYEMEYKNSIPKGYIRIAFCLKPSDSIADCNTTELAKKLGKLIEVSMSQSSLLKLKTVQKKLNKKLWKKLGTL